MFAQVYRISFKILENKNHVNILGLIGYCVEGNEQANFGQSGFLKTRIRLETFCFVSISSNSGQTILVSLQSRWIMLKICQLHILKADEPSAPGRVMLQIWEKSSNHRYITTQLNNTKIT